MESTSEKKTALTEKVRVAAVQMVSGPEVAENLETASRLVAEAAGRGARLVLLPEYFAIMGRRDKDKVKAREEEGRGPIQEFLAATAARHRIWLVGGSVPLAVPEPDKIANSCLAFDPQGQRAARYDKIHLFRFHLPSDRYDESLTIRPGSRPVVLPTPLASVGLTICYDIRFPELYRALGRIDLVLVPAAFTETTGRDHWEILLRARAIENQCYLLASAQGGRHESGRETHGNSMLIDPWGRIMDRLAKGPGIVVGDLDPAQLQEVRQKLPALEHRVFAVEAPGPSRETDPVGKGKNG